MIAVTVVFACIAYFEWRYLRRHRRRPRTVRIVIGFIAILWLLTFTIACLRDRFSLGLAVSSLFEPLQRLLYMDG